MMRLPPAAESAARHRLRRARPLLGTLVTIELEASAGAAVDGGAAVQAALAEACTAAFAVIEHVGRVMSAHCPASDLGRLARAAPDTVLTLDPHTAAVLRAARQWHRASGGAFDPARAARTLAAYGLRPAFAGCQDAVGTLQDLAFIDATRVRVAAPPRLDLGGIAKGYAVDAAVQALRDHGVNSALVNAGGDLRAIGTRRWPIALRGRAAPLQGHTSRGRTSLHLQDAALATSELGWDCSEFVRCVRGRRGRNRLRAVTVQASDCMAADALTKWALQAGPASPRLQRALRQAKASLRFVASS